VGRKRQGEGMTCQKDNEEEEKIEGTLQLQFNVTMTTRERAEQQAL
jgi:hypothetical protein